MRIRIFNLLFLLLLGAWISQTNAQDRTVRFNVNGAGVSKPIIWGLDLAWLSEGNLRRGLAFMGSDRVDVVRSSFSPTDPIVNGELTGDALTKTNLRISHINKWLGSNTQVVLNCNHSSIHPSFSGNAAEWAKLIDITTRMHQDAGRTVVTVSPFNEPDYTATGQGTKSDFYRIAGELRNNTLFNNIRISGGNTLNTDQALNWYNYLKNRLDEGNTHQLAGSFDNYANFYQTVRANNHHATNDELHNVMEAMVGVEYGMQSGIWWGTAEYARGEFVKASDGVRLGYAEHRNNWTAASVYRAPDGKVQAFLGCSERQAATTTYKFVSENMDVFFDGHGPYREYIMEIPGGWGYGAENGQKNAERVINITWGEDVQPVIDGRYVLVNRNSGLVMEVADGSTSNGANVQQNNYTGARNQQWNVNPVDSRIGGDYSYFTITNVNSGKALDILNWSLENGGNIAVWDNNLSSIQQYYLEYAEDGWFYIRSRHSAKCLDVSGVSTSPGANVQQWDKTNGSNQQWRLLPVGAPIEFTAPNAPTNLAGTTNTSSIQLTWTASTSSDVTGYTIFRTEEGGEYNTIARYVTSTSYTDNTVELGKQYHYKINAVDQSLNRSTNSDVIGPLSVNRSNLTYHHMHNRHTNKCISIKNGSTSNNANIVQSDCNSSLWRQQWELNDLGNGYFQIKSRHSNKCLRASGDNIVQYTCYDHYWTEMFSREYTDNGYYIYRNRHSNKCLRIENSSTSSGASIVLWDCNKDYWSQQFKEFNLKNAEAEIEDVQLAKERDFDIYPSPANNILNIKLSGESPDKFKITIHDNLGKLAHSTEMLENQSIIDIRNLSPGVYIIRLSYNEEFYVRKFIKK